MLYAEEDKVEIADLDLSVTRLSASAVTADPVGLPLCRLYDLGSKLGPLLVGSYSSARLTRRQGLTRRLPIGSS